MADGPPDAGALRDSPLAAVHERLGATFTGFAGWRMPVRYAGHLSEHAAVRTAAGLFDLSHMGELVISGPAAAASLDRALPLHASAMPSGRARYTLLLASDGGVLDDLVIYRTGETAFLVIANAANVATVREALTGRLRPGAELRDASAEYALVAIQGPRSTAILAPLAGTDPAALRYYTCVETRVAGRPALLARTGYTGEIGYELFLTPDDAGPVWTALQEAGAPAGLVPAGLAARDTLRLEAGMALYGNELTAEVTPLQAGLGFALPRDKPDDHVGRAALAALRTEHPDGPPTVLVGLAGDGRRAARAGSAVHPPDGGSPIGTVTSGVLSPTLGHPIALAYLPASYQPPGTAVAVDVRGQPLPMRVVERPFYRRST